MKTMKALSNLLLASMVLAGTACSTSSDATSGSASGTATSTDASTAGAGNSGASNGTPSTSATGTDAGGAGASATGGTAGGGTTATTGTGNPADITAFMATFATMQDPVFLMTAASSNLLEIQSGRMALQKSTNADVKKFGQMMIDHHTKATQEMQTVATPLGVTLPQIMMPVHQAMADKLAAKSGKDFDEEYMDMMETAHQMDIAMFEVKSKAAEAPAVKAFATKTLPMLRSHRSMAGDIEKKVD